MDPPSRRPTTLGARASRPPDRPKGGAAGSSIPALERRKNGLPPSEVAAELRKAVVSASEMASEPRDYGPSASGVVRLRHMSLSTEKIYVFWIRRYILFHGKRHPKDMGEAEVTAFLTDLATRRQVSASTQNQALSALLFLYRHIIGRDLGRLPAVRARRKRKLPVVLSRAEVRRLLDQLHGVHHLIATLLYGSGLRLMEGLRLRVKDLDFDYEQITVRDGKGAKDRVTMLPSHAKTPLREQLSKARELHLQRYRELSHLC